MTLSKLKEIRGHAGAIYTCAAHGDFVYTGSADKYVARWNIHEGVQDTFAIKFEQAVYCIALIHDRWLWVGLADGTVHVFDLTQRKEVNCFTQHRKAVFAIRWNPFLNQVYIGDADGNLSIWEAENRECLMYLPLDCGKIRDIAVDTRGERIALACQDGTFRCFETTYFNEFLTVNAHDGGTTSVLYHPRKAHQLITGGKDAFLRLWDVEKSVQLREVPAHNFAIYSLVNLWNQHIASASRDKTIKLWDDDLNFVQRLDHKDGGHQYSVNQMITHENRLISVSDDKRICIWAEQ